MAATGQTTTTTANGNLMLISIRTRRITCQTKLIDPVSPVQLLTIQYSFYYYLCTLDECENG